MDLSEVLDDFGIAQYGVRGMRWGVRRPVGTGGLVKRTEGSSSASPGHASGGQKSSADHERATNALNKAHEHGRSSLSNEELTALTKRIESERKFVQLTSGEKSALQKQVEQMRLEKDYRQLRAEAKQANRSTGRRIIDSILKSASDAAMKQASSYGEKLVKELLSDSGLKPHTRRKSGTNLPKVGAGVKVPKSGKGKPPPFRVNPNKVKFTKPQPQYNNLPKLKPTGP